MSTSKVTYVAIGEAVASKLGMPKSKGAELGRTFVGEIIESLKKGTSVELTGLATLSIETTKARTGHNPKTREVIQIPAKKRVKTSVSGKLKKSL
ncbi:MAG: HU family DNA-binding protein [Brevinemataceae bacterium]